MQGAESGGAAASVSGFAFPNRFDDEIGNDGKNDGEDFENEFGLAGRHEDDPFELGVNEENAEWHQFLDSPSCSDLTTKSATTGRAAMRMPKTSSIGLDVFMTRFFEWNC